MGMLLGCLENLAKQRQASRAPRMQYQGPCKAGLLKARAGLLGTTIAFQEGLCTDVSNQLKEDEQCQHHTGKMIAITHRRVLHGNGLLPNV